MTVYGQNPRGGHTGLKVLVGVAVVVVLVAVFVVWRSATSDATPVARPSASSAPATSASPSPSASTSSAPPGLSTGTWLIALAGGSGLYLTKDGDYAAMSSGERTVFTVVKGLADASCFSLREPGGKYLRHFDYRLRFDNPDNGSLFPKDATFCPVSGTAAGVVRLRSDNYPDHVIHSRGEQVYIDKPDGKDAFTADSSFSLVAA